MNPFGFQPGSAETARVMAPGGRLAVTGSIRNPFLSMSPEAIRAAGFRLVSSGPMISRHAFGVQRFTDGRSINVTRSITNIYERL